MEKDYLMWAKDYANRAEHSDYEETRQHWSRLAIASALIALVERLDKLTDDEGKTTFKVQGFIETPNYRE